MIRLHFSIKRRVNKGLINTSTKDIKKIDKLNSSEVTGKIVSVGFHFIDQPKVRKGLVRLTTIDTDKFHRLRNNQLVITPDGLGVIKDYKLKKDPENRLILPDGLDVRVRGVKNTKKYYNLKAIKVVDIIDSEKGTRYPASVRDYYLLVIDDMPIEYVYNKDYTASLSLSSREKLSSIKILSKKPNGINILNELIAKKIWKIAR
jgi:hypothetical protein